MNMTSEIGGCPLCGAERPSFYHKDTRREYLQCPICRLVSVPSCFWLRRDEEKAVYDLHRNDALDQGYRRFLSRLVTPMLQRLDARQNGLDFGCGPGPALPLMFEEQGHQVQLFDPFYCNDISLLTGTYDFICATEVVEHLQNPAQEFARLFAMLKPGGWLGIMTKLVIDIEAFSNWHYIRDLTHISFFSRNTFQYLANRYSAELTFAAGDVILLRKVS